MNSPSASVRRISGTFVANVCLYGLAAVSGPLTARFLGPDGRGTLAAIQLWPGAIATLAMLGLPEAVAYFAAREPNRGSEWLSTAVVTALAASGVAAAAGYTLISIGLKRCDASVVRTAQMYLLLVPLTALIGLPCQLARGLGQFAVWNALRLAPALGWVSVLVIAAVSGMRTPEGLTLLYLRFLLFEAVVVAIACTRLSRPRQWFNRATAATMLRYGLPSGLSAVPQLLNLRLDQMLIAALLPTRQLGLYVVAVSWSTISGVVLNAVGPVFSQRLAAERDTTLARTMFGRASRAAVVVSGITAAAFAVITPLAITLLYGTAYRECIPVGMVLVMANALLTLNLVLEEGLRGLGDTSTIFKAELAGLVATALSLAVCLPAFGIMGAAAASVAGYAAVAITLGLSLRRHDLSLATTFRPRLADLRYVITVGTAWYAVRRGAGDAIA